MDKIVALLQELGPAGQALQAAADAEDTAAKLQAIKGMALDASHVTAARKLSASSQGAALWEQLASLAVPLADVARALAGVISMAGQQQALLAAAVYSHLLITSGCPVFSLFDRTTCSIFLKLLRDAASGGGKRSGAKGGKKAGSGAGGDAMDIDEPAGDGADSEGEDGAGPSQRGGKKGSGSAAGAAAGSAGALAESLRNLAALLGGFGLRDQPDTVKSVAEAAAEVSRAGAAGGTGGADVAEACYAVLGALLQPMHAPQGMQKQAATVFFLLTSNVAGAGEPGKAAAEAVRARAIQFAKESLRRVPECAEAVGALARNVILRAPDKATARSAAVEGAVALARLLEVADQQRFVGFVARLSRTAKVNQRLMGVELAPVLLEAFDDPFAPVDLAPQRPAAGSAAAGSAAAPAGGVAQGAAGDGKAPANLTTLMVDGQERMAAPWGAVLLAVLVQRCSDKAAAVRGRAMQNLAGVVAAWASFNGGNSREEVRFVAALSLAHEVKLQPQPLLGPTPGLLSPSELSPAKTDEPGGTPMLLDENTPHPGNAATSARRGGRGGANKPAGGSAAASRCLTCFTMPATSLLSGLLLEGGEGAGEADLKSLLHAARRRCGDEKGQVRKAAVQLLEALLVMRAAGVQRTLPQPKDVAAIEAATADALVSVRKAGLAAAYSLLKALPDQAPLAQLWAAAALPLIRDVEASVQEAVLDQFQDLVTGRAVAAGAGAGREGGPTSSADKAAQELRPILAAFAAGGGACRACVARACGQLKAKSRLRTKQAAAGLQQIILGLGAPAAPADPAADADAVAGAWLLYCEVSSLDPAAPSWRFLQQQWDELMQQGAGGVGTAAFDGMDAEGEEGAAVPAGPAAPAAGDNAAQLLKVIAAAAAEFPADQARQLAEQLLAALQGFTLAPAAAAAHVAAVAQLTERHGGGGAAGWAPGLLAGAEQVLAGYVECQAGRTQAGMQAEDWRAAGALFTVGEVALLRACKPSGRLVVLVQALTSSRMAAAPAAATASQAAASEELAAGAGARAEVPSMVQALAWVSLGKLCLVDEPLAKRCVPLFVQELGRAAAPAVRNNIMVALADLVINYTALVDSHVPRLASCIRDPNELVRSQALALLANLLQKDYVKWRGPLFHRFLLALIDDSPRVAGLAEYLLADTIATKLPNLAYNHFVEALFVLNDCTVGLHGGAAAAAAVAEAGGSSDRSAFCLKGSSPRMRAKRDAIYKALLQRMSPEHKFATAARLCQEVLGGAADGALPLEECGEVLGDALRILASKHIKVTASKAAADDTDAADAAAAVGAAKGKLVSAMMKKHLVEGVVPVIIELKRGMEAARHPLLGDLMAATATMLKDYKGEIEDILVADKQLAKEILYDMRQAEAAKAAAKAAPPLEAGAGAGAAGTPLAGGAMGGRQGGLPAGTSANTPMAAEVLLTARKAAAARTPGGGLHASKTPGSAYKTPGAPPTAAKTHSTGGRTISRLARASGPLPSPHPEAAPASAAAPPLSAPRLRGATGRTPGAAAGAAAAGGRASRLRPKDHDALAQQTAALAVSDAAAAAAGASSAAAAAALADDESEEQQQVALPFAAPGAPGAVPPQQWNVSAEAAQLESGVAEAAGRAETEAGGAAAGGGAEEEPRGRSRGRGKRKQSSPENAPPSQAMAASAGAAQAASAAVKEEKKGGNAGGSKGRASRKRKA